MTILLLGLILVALAVGLEAYSKKHALDGLKAKMVPEDLLAEPGQPARLHLTLCNQKGWPRPLVSLKLHLGPVFELEEASYIHKDVLGNGRTVQLVTWLRPRQQASWQVEVRLSRRGRYLLEPLYLGSGDFLGMT